MAKSIRVCKVCGKEYEYCKTWNAANKFRWQDVACSPECGTAYFKEIEASRSHDSKDAAPTQKKATKKSVKKIEVAPETEVLNIEADSSLTEESKQ